MSPTRTWHKVEVTPSSVQLGSARGAVFVCTPFFVTFPLQKSPTFLPPFLVVLSIFSAVTFFLSSFSLALALRALLSPFSISPPRDSALSHAGPPCRSALYLLLFPSSISARHTQKYVAQFFFFLLRAQTMNERQKCVPATASNARARCPGGPLLHEFEQLPPLDGLALEVPREVHASGVVAVPARSTEAGDRGHVPV